MPSLWEQHRTAIVLSMITAVLGAIAVAMVTGIGKWAWDQIHPVPAGTKADVVVVDWRTYSDTPTKPADATMSVHKDGTASAGACFAHWVTVAGKELAVSSEFGLAPSQAKDLKLVRAQSSYKFKLLVVNTETYAYVTCSGATFGNSPHIMSKLFSG
jgi:hypothetical protein